MVVGIYCTVTAAAAAAPCPSWQWQSLDTADARGTRGGGGSRGAATMLPVLPRSSRDHVPPYQRVGGEQTPTTPATDGRPTRHDAGVRDPPPLAYPPAASRRLGCTRRPPPPAPKSALPSSTTAAGLPRAVSPGGVPRWRQARRASVPPCAGRPAAHPRRDSKGGGRGELRTRRSPPRGALSSGRAGARPLPAHPSPPRPPQPPPSIRRGAPPIAACRHCGGRLTPLRRWWLPRRRPPRPRQPPLPPPSGAQARSAA